METRTEYATKRRAPNNTEYHFNMKRVQLDGAVNGMYVILVKRIKDKWWNKDETLLFRAFYDYEKAMMFFEHLLSVFPRDALYKE